MHSPALKSFVSLLLLLLARTADGQSILQLAWVNGTMTFAPSPAGSANVFIRDATAVATFATRTREMFVAGIAARPDLNPLFNAPPQVLSLDITQAVNSNNGIAVSFNSKVRMWSASFLNDATFAQNIQFSPYFTVDAVIRDYLGDLASSIPAVFGSVTGVVGDIQKGKIRPPPRPVPAPTQRPATAPTRLPAASPTRRPAASPTRRPVSPTRRPGSPTRRPSPTNRPPSCLSNSNVCGTNDAICCSKRCAAGVCQPASRGLALKEPQEEEEQSYTQKNVRGGV
jgi:hypothetical protein